jgi:hypothetical protein
MRKWPAQSANWVSKLQVGGNVDGGSIVLLHLGFKPKAHSKNPFKTG